MRAMADGRTDTGWRAEDPVHARALYNPQTTR
jgi:hypothetical protein